MPEPRRRWIRAPMWLGLAAAATLVWYQARTVVRLVPAADAPAAPELLLAGEDGTVFDLASLEGRVVVLHLWAEWCGVCRREIPELSRLHEERRDTGLVVLGLHADPLDAGRSRELARRLGIAYPIVTAVGALEGPFEGRGVVPHTWIIDRAGRIRASHAGAVGIRSLEKACERLLDRAGEPPSPPP